MEKQKRARGKKRDTLELFHSKKSALKEKLDVNDGKLNIGGCKEYYKPDHNKGELQVMPSPKKEKRSKHTKGTLEVLG